MHGSIPRSCNNMIHLLRTDAHHPGFETLVKLLDADLAARDGDEHPFYAQFNKTNSIKHCVVAFEQDVPVGCGALKPYSPLRMEIKRMFVLPGYRGQGIASQVLAELEKWAAELSYAGCILETGIKQPEAMALYRKNGYHRIPNYGQYADVQNSVCFEKILS